MFVVPWSLLQQGLHVVSLAPSFLVSVYLSHSCDGYIIYIHTFCLFFPSSVFTYSIEHRSWCCVYLLLSVVGSSVLDSWRMFFAGYPENIWLVYWVISKWFSFIPRPSRTETAQHRPVIPRLVTNVDICVLLQKKTLLIVLCRKCRFYLNNNTT